ncbi:MAG: porin [bacterium]
MNEKVPIRTVLVGVLGFIAIVAVQHTVAQSTNDTLKEQVITFRDKVTGIEERIATAENSLEKLTKIKISGYIQAQWENFENPAAYPYNYFSVRRARIKFQYEPVGGVIFVLQPDFAPSGVTIKDAYVQVNEPWLKTFSLWAGQFNRPNYEVEYSSSRREVPERSRVIRALYPGERAIGAKLEVTPPAFPLKFQLALLNGNDNMIIKDMYGIDINPKNKDFDPYKDLMGRVTYNFKLGNFGGLDIGVNGYYGWIKSNSTYVLNSDYVLDKTVTLGQSVPRHWVGAEMQLYMDILGGMAIKGEYILGINAYPGYNGSTLVANPVLTTLANDTLTMTYLTTNTSIVSPTIRRNFQGGYLYLIKNIGKRNQFAFRWDFYDPNTKLKGNQIGVVKYDNSASTQETVSTESGSNPVIILNETTKTVTSNSLKSGSADIAYNTFTMAWNYFFTDNIRITLAYEIPLNEKAGLNSSGVSNLISKSTVNGNPVTNDYSRVFPQNVLTIRFQAKF